MFTAPDISQILTLPNKTLLALLGESASQRHINTTELTQLADTLHLPDLVADINDLQGVNRQQGVIIQHTLKRKYKAIKIPESALDNVDMASHLPLSTPVDLPAAHSETTPTEPIRHRQLDDLVSPEREVLMRRDPVESRPVMPKNTHLGVVAWFNGEYGVIKSRFGEAFVHKNNNPSLTLTEGDTVRFEEHLDSVKNRSNAKKCKTILSFDDYEDKLESVATISYFLFEQFSLAPASLKRTLISPETLEALIRYRLSLTYPLSIVSQQASLIIRIPEWEELVLAIGDKIIGTQSFDITINPIVSVVKTLQQRVPAWFVEGDQRQYLFEQCFWRPVQYCSGKLPASQFLDYIVYTNQTVNGLWPLNAVPTWCLDELRANLNQWCVTIQLDDELLEMQARERVQVIARWLKIDPVPFEQLFRYTSVYQLKKWLKQPDNFAFPLPQTTDEIVTLIQQIPADRLPDALTYLSVDQVTAAYPVLTATATQVYVVSWLFDKQIQSFGSVTFDIETNSNETIREVCFTLENSFEVYRPINQKTLPICINAFQKTIDQAKLLVGHNIREFDIPILAKHNVDFGQLPIWDTLEMEALLSPLLRSFALVTTHDASSDTKKTVALFRNQLQRILLGWTQYGPLVQPFIPSEIFQVLQKFVVTFQDSLSFSADDDRNLFFHEETTEPPINFSHFTFDEPTLLVAPRLTWPLFVRLPAVEFVTVAANTSDVVDAFEELDPFTTRFDIDKIQAVVQHQYLQKALLAYVVACQKAHVAPTIANLPLWTKLRLQTELTHLRAICHDPTSLPEQAEPHIFYITDDSGALLLTTAQGARWTLHHTNESLSSITFKHRLGQIRLQDISDIFNQTSLWTRMVGGNRFAPISREWLTNRPGVMIPHPQLNNFWLEKQTPTEFTVWGNTTRPQVSSSFSADQDSDEPLQSSTVELSPLTLVYAKEQAGLFYRLNPETPYRDVYWTGQFYLLQQLDTQQPIVWLIQHDHELPHLQAMVESMGYWCPPTERSLVRRLEMLHQSSHRRRVLIVTLSVLPKLTQINYWGSLTLIIDSLPLTEITMMVNQETVSQPEPDTSVTDEVKEEDKADEQPIDENDSRPIEVQSQKLQRIDSAGSFRLIAPLIDYYRRMLFQNNSANHLILIDPRLIDQVGLAKRWSAKKLAVILWQTKADYEALYSQIAKYIPSPKQITLNLSDLATIQRTIERVFLGQNERGEWLTLRENQQPYFDSIIQPTDDLIVSLPTGGGKSVLFQGPALYRGSLSNRLTIVVTPLRALMEDQVAKLEELGFFGCVEFINQQSDNIQDIYRRIAGGEITLVYVTPERFRSRSFDQALKMRMLRDHGLEYCVFDEAHCISQWGSEFRPDYLWVATLISRLKKANGNFPVLFFSATISDQIYNDLTEIFSDQTDR